MHAAQPPSPLHRRARDAGSRLARWASRARDLAALRRGAGANTPPEVLLRQSAHGGFVASTRPPGAPALGHRAAISRTQKRARPRSFRRSHVARLATPCRAHGRRARLHSTRAHAPRRGWANVSRCARHRAGDLHRAALCRETALHALDGTGETRTPTTDLTKSN